MKKYNNVTKVRNMLTAGGNYAPNQFIISEDRKTIFQSYNSIICTLDYENSIITFGRDWNYSRTTAKYLYSFLNSFIDFYGTKKELEKLIDVGKYETKFTNWTVQYDHDLI